MMKISILALLFCSVVLPTDATANKKAELSPISRVVDLLESLSKQTEKEGEKEQNLYETFVCWAKSVIEQKTNANSAAGSRIDMLETYIADLESGRIELTTERADLEKEVEELMGDMEVATAARNKENADFLEAEAEMSKAVKALNSAIEVLGEATKSHKKGVLIAMRARLNGGMEALVEQQASLKHAVELGDRFLNKADNNFLKRLLLGDVPKVDWKKLNRKATFKMAYKARSFKIQDVLKKLHQTFAINLKDAQSKEKTAKSQYDTLTKAKQGQLDATRTALTKMESENGASGMSKQESIDEVADLKKQVASDEKFIKETSTSLATKKKEWKARQDLRSGEIAAISKAIYILHNDEARDNFKKSLQTHQTAQSHYTLRSPYEVLADSSQRFLFLQTQQTAGLKFQMARGATVALREAAHLSGDARLLLLANALANPSVKTKFGPVLAAIDKMVAILKGNEITDLETKDTCEVDRMESTKGALDLGRRIDSKQMSIHKHEAHIIQTEVEIQKLMAEEKKAKEEVASATQIRNDQHAAWKLSDEEDKDAAKTVASAAAVLEKFYKDNKLVLAQVTRQPASQAGEAPPPPPPTWEGGYGGKTGESQGIVAVLDMIKADILKDQQTAKAEEDASSKDYTRFSNRAIDTQQSCSADRQKLQALNANRQMVIQSAKKDQRMIKGRLDKYFEYFEKIDPHCEYFEVNYPLRVKNRQIELDGLTKAKAILEGGKFDAGPDPSREIKPGDAASANFLQISRH